MGGEVGAEGALNDVGNDLSAGGALEVGDGVEVLEEGEVVGGDVGGAEGDFALGWAVVGGWGGFGGHGLTGLVLG